MSIEENKTIARRFYEEAFNQQDFAVCDEHFAADFVLDFPAGPGTLHGLPGIKQAVTTFLSAFPDTSMTIEDMIAEGDKVVVHWTYRGTHHGELLGIPRPASTSNLMAPTSSASPMASSSKSASAAACSFSSASSAWAHHQDSPALKISAHDTTYGPYLYRCGPLHLFLHF
jgi:steroid delta-isomerase-like uncharacterized protein